jgi:PAS domain S-box-containing protein
MAEESKQAKKTGVPILIVEDDPAVAALISGVAEKRGHSTKIASSAEEAQDIWLSERQPLIILDLNLPGVSGIDFCKWVRSKETTNKDTFVLISTANNKIETFHEVLNAGANDYLPKPVQPGLLAIRLDVAEHTIGQIIRKRKLEGEVDRNEKRFRLISENSRDLVCTHSPDGKITYASPSSHNLIGYTQEELIGKSFEELKLDLNAAPLNTNMSKDEANGQIESTQTWRVKHKEGQEVWLETYTQTGEEFEKPELKEIYSYSRDVTDRVHEEAQLKILSVLGDSSDSESFLKAMIMEMEQTMDAEVCIHIHSTSPDSLSYCIHKDNVLEEVVTIHRNINRATPNDKPIYQGSNAAGVFNHVEGTGELEAIITEPIPGTFGRAIGKITMFSKNRHSESERTKAILTLCATKIGNVLEEHLTK